LSRDYFHAKMLSLTSSNISVYSFNCRSLKSSITEVRDLYEQIDFVCLQEQWLVLTEIFFVSTISKGFLAVGRSAVELQHDILSGRPYGGTAILYRKPLSKFVTVLYICNPRVSALSLQCSAIWQVSIFIDSI